MVLGALRGSQDGPDGVTAMGMHAALTAINAFSPSPQMYEALWLTLARPHHVPPPPQGWRAVLPRRHGRPRLLGL